MAAFCMPLISDRLITYRSLDYLRRTLCICVCLCVCISLGGEGNALHPVLSSLLCLLLLYFTARLDYRNEYVIEM